jgi:hypothetical protein
MSRGNFTNLPPPARSAINPLTHGPLSTRLSGYDVVRFDDNVKAKRTRIVSPYLSFETERPAMKTFRGMLKVMDKKGFSFVLDFDGPDLGITRGRAEGVLVDEVLEALLLMDASDVPWLLGIRTVLMKELDQDVTIKIKVKAGRETKVKVKVKGTLRRPTWDQIRADIKRKFHVKV